METNKVIFESKEGKKKSWVIPSDTLFNNMIEDFKDRLSSLHKVGGWVKQVYDKEDIKEELD